MAPLTAVPTPGLNAAVLESLRRERVREGPGAAGFMQRLAQRLSPKEAESLPQAFALVIPLLAGDLDRLRFASRVAVTFDLYETASAVASMGQRTHDPDVILAAASLSSGPGVSSSVYETVEELVQVELRGEVGQSGLLRLSPVATVHNDRQRDLVSQAWPGSKLPRSEGAAVVGIEAKAPNQDQYWKFLSDLVSAGVIIRRIPDQWQRDAHPSWLHRELPLVLWNEHLVGQLQRQGFALTEWISPGPLITDQNRKDALAFLATRLPVALRLPAGPPVTLQSDESPLDPLVFQSGSFDAIELAFLGGGSSSSIYKLIRQDVLAPRRHAATGKPAWSFSQLVAFRTWRFVSSSTGTRPRKTLLERLERMAVQRDVSVVAVTSTGHLLRNVDGVYVDVETGQQVFEDIVKLDRVFQPFEFGGGMTPPLLAPSDRVTVHPTRLGGTPALISHRISARGLVNLERKHGWDSLVHAYPDVAEDLLLEGLNVGERMLASK